MPQQGVFALAGLAIFAPVVLHPNDWPWLGAALAALALFGLLALLWRAGRIRGIYILAFALVLLAVLLFAGLSGHA